MVGEAFCIWDCDCIWVKVLDSGIFDSGLVGVEVVFGSEIIYSSRQVKGVWDVAYYIFNPCYATEFSCSKAQGSSVFFSSAV